MKLGVCYYPEHWPQERWASDAHLMREAGIQIVRIGEFAWAQLEPEEGRFDWGWLDRAVATLAEAGLQVVLGTPTPAPPAWLVQAYPDVLPVDSQGRTQGFGSRRHACPNSTSYHRLSERIVRALAERYGHHPAMIGWQIDNEFGCHNTARCYCERCAAAFRRWLQARYGDLPAFNEAWGNAFWSQWYSDWEQVGPPMLTPAQLNPSHLLDYWRFSSDSWVAYEGLQARVLREAGDPARFVAHNYMGSFPDLDYHKLAEPLDLVTWDSYPTGYAEQTAPGLYLPDEARAANAHDVGDPYVTGFCHAITRGIKQAPFWVMEQQPGAINWATYNTGVAPGAVRLWTWHALAEGADAVVYFRWRACRFGFEQMHAGLRKHDGSPDQGWLDVAGMLGERGLMDEIGQALLAPEAAILSDYEDLWAVQIQPHRQGFSYQRAQFVLYRACQRLGIPCDIVSPRADLSRYKLIFAPALLLATDPLVRALRGHVEAGGNLVLGVRSGFKTETNVVTDLPLPGLFRDLVAANVTAWHALPPGVSYDVALDGEKYGAETWAEALHPDAGTSTLAEWTTGPFAGQAALTQARAGKGRAAYWGWHPNLEQAVAVVAKLAEQAGVRRLAQPLPDGVLRVPRGKRVLWFNFADHAQMVEVGEDVVIIPPRDLVIA
ncbi:MAG: beta-galactosidase [Nitrososphaerales archaeon]